MVLDERGRSIELGHGATASHKRCCLIPADSTWTALRNAAFRKLWIAAVISGTCMLAHENAATWMMNILAGSPFLLSLMSTVASLAFFISLSASLQGDVPEQKDAKGAKG